MKLYLITQDYYTGYDVYDSAIVCAKYPEDARSIYPGTDISPNAQERWEAGNMFGGDWPEYKNRDKVSVKYIGEASPRIKRGVVLASFNAG